MNSKQAKLILISDFLKAHNHIPTKQTGNELHYFSPFRKETAPSFHVNISKNVWHDKGTGNGGNILDLVMEMFDCKGNISQALSFLSKQKFALISDIEVKQQKADSLSNTNAITKIIKLQHPALFRYLKKRKVTETIAKRYLSEVHYCLNDKDYFALGMINRKEGYELRNAYFKGCIGKKSFTVIDGSDKSSYALFEGMFDFLAWAVLNRFEDALPHPIIVLNSTYMVNDVCIYLKEKEASTIKCFLDNDEAGKVAFESVNNCMKTVSVIDNSNLYPDHRDLSEFLVKTSSRF
jgi:DNA primase